MERSLRAIPAPTPSRTKPRPMPTRSPNSSQDARAKTGFGTWAMLAFMLPSPATAQRPEGPPPERSPRQGGPSQGEEGDRGAKPRGLIQSSEDSQAGYTLYAPLKSLNTYLIDAAGEVVHEWKSEQPPGNSVYLQADGSLLRCGRDNSNEVFHGGGQGGRLQRLAPDGTVLWDWACSDETQLHHHDIEPLPNGNILVIAWEMATPEETIAAGRDPQKVNDKGFWPDKLIEIRPILPDSAEVVWEWHTWDHVIQDFDRSKANFGDVTAHPERIDINSDHRDEAPLSAAERRKRQEEERQMRALGYTGDDDDEEDADEADGRREERLREDWLHTNSIDYNAEHNLVMVSARTLNEFWIIDHSTTTAEAKSSKGGRFGRGGDLLYRWGNPRTYGAGTKADQRLFVQHDASFATAADGSLAVMVFNNGRGRSDGDYSSVDLIAPAFDAERGFTYTKGQAFGPRAATWSYSAEEKSDFYSSFISGAQQLSGGNVLICSGAQGRVFEVTPDKRVVWDYENPHGGDAPLGRPEGRDRGEGRERGRGGDRREGGPPPGRPLGPPGGGPPPGG
ncbi:MAG: hypothetical protein ACI835_002419, partial [Planctomycetota bacterium]